MIYIDAVIAISERKIQQLTSPFHTRHHK